MNKKDKQKSKFTSIINEIAYDLGINKKLVKEVLILTFKEVAVILLLRGKNVMIRRFVKFVGAVKGIRKMRKNMQELETKEKWI